MLEVVSVCTPCCMLLLVVAQRLKSVKLFSYVQTLNNVRRRWPTMLFYVPFMVLKYRLLTNKNANHYALTWRGAAGATFPVYDF